MNGSYVQVRRGILEHVERGELPPLQFAAYVLLILSADSASGIVLASARLLAVKFGFSDRGARQVLEELARKGYVRRFVVRGSHRNYPILINRYLVTQGAMKGRMLNAVKSGSYAQPVYEVGEESRADSVEVRGEETREVTAPYQEREVAGKREITTRLAFDGNRLKITEQQDKRLADQFPVGVDRQEEYGKADAWLKNSPRDSEKFILGSWLPRVQAPGKNGGKRHTSGSPNLISPEGTNPRWYCEHQSVAVVPGEWDRGLGCVCERCTAFRNAPHRGASSLGAEA